MNKSKGFTIIELIVVIAIIAVLAGIVLVNVTSYINKSKDAAIKSNMYNIMVTAVAANAENSLASSTITGNTAWTKTQDLATAANTFTNVDLANKKFCACAKLIVPTTATYYCIDTNGVPKETTTACAAANCGAAVSPFCP